MKILVTGAGGFAGSHIIDYLLEYTDWDIIAMYRSTVNVPVDRDRITVVIHDLTTPITFPVTRLIEDVDVVINLASVSDVPTFLASPVRCTLDNVNIALTLFEWARWNPPSLFIQVSTNEVYGPAESWQRHNERSMIQPTTPYSGSKAAQEAVATAWRATYDIPVVIVNTMHLFGPRQPRERFIPTAIRNIVADQPVPIYGRRTIDGRWLSPSRNWLYVRDFAVAIHHLITKVGYVQGGLNRWNVAGPQLTCVRIAIRLAGIIGRKVKINTHDAEDTQSRPGYDLRYELDTSALESTGLILPVDINLGLQETVDWFTGSGD